MKKLIFLLMAVVLAGMAFAQDTAHPPGAFALEAAMSGDGVDGCAVTPDTVLVMAMPVTAEMASFQAVMALYNESAIRPQLVIYNLRHQPDYFWRK
jgi:hypothetical protein